MLSGRHPRRCQSRCDPPELSVCRLVVSMLCAPPASSRAVAVENWREPRARQPAAPSRRMLRRPRPAQAWLLVPRMREHWASSVPSHWPWALLARRMIHAVRSTRDAPCPSPFSACPNASRPVASLASSRRALAAGPLFVIATEWSLFAAWSTGSSACGF